MSDLSGIVVTSSGSEVQLIAVHDWETKELVNTLSPNSNGTWSLAVEPGAYQVTYYTECCAPVCYGPYYV